MDETRDQGAAAGGRVERANRLLAGHRPGEPEFRSGLELLTRAAGDGDPEAQWHLAALYLQVAVLPDARHNAAKWLERAAEAGVPQAADRLATLCVEGLGAERDDRRALSLWRGLAERGFQPAAWHTGYLCSELGEADSAITAFARCWALGSPEGYYSLGLRFALGSGTTKDPAFARALLIRASDAGLADARTAADEYAPREEYGREAKLWYDRMKACHRAAQPLFAQLGEASAEPGPRPLVKRLEAHFAALDHPSIRLDPDGRLRVAAGGGESLTAGASGWDWRSDAPRVGVCDDFATREECTHLIQMILPYISDPRRYRRGNAYGDLTYFSGEGCPVGPMEADAVIRMLERRIARMTEHSPEALEPCSIVHYRHAQEYRPHTDFFDEEQLRINREQYGDTGGQRLATFLLYLQPPASGGETRYVHPDLTIRGATGLGILHYNVTPDGKPDPASTHVGMPVESGDKWLWRSALRERPLEPVAGG